MPAASPMESPAAVTYNGRVAPPRMTGTAALVRRVAGPL